MKGLIGILGGMGPQATLDAYARLIANTPATTDQQHIPVLITSLPDIPDRSACILHGGPSPYPRLLQSLKMLENAGAQCIIITCNTAHYWFNDLKKQTSVPMINMIDVTCEQIQQQIANQEVKQKIKQQVALLATTATVQTNLYQARLSSQGIDCVLPTEAEQQQVMQSIYAFKAKNYHLAKECLFPVWSRLHNNGADRIILGCTELPLILQQEILQFTDLFINPTEILSQSVVAWYYTQVPPPSAGQT